MTTPRAYVDIPDVETEGTHDPGATTAKSIMATMRAA